MIDKVIIGKIIKTLRTNKKLTQEELAEKIDISKNYLSKIERGISVLNVEAFLKMAQVLEFSLSDFGINYNQSNITKNEFINFILSSTDKEIDAYYKIIKTINKIAKI